MASIGKVAAVVSADAQGFFATMNRVERRINSVVGPRSGLAKIGKLFIGAGALRVVSMMAGEVERAAKFAKELSDQFYAGKISAEQFNLELAKTIPLFGAILKAGLAVRDLIAESLLHQVDVQGWTVGATGTSRGDVLRQGTVTAETEKAAEKIEKGLNAAILTRRHQLALDKATTTSAKARLNLVKDITEQEQALADSFQRAGFRLTSGMRSQFAAMLRDVKALNREILSMLDVRAIEEHENRQADYYTAVEEHEDGLEDRRIAYAKAREQREQAFFEKSEELANRAAGVYAGMLEAEEDAELAAFERREKREKWLAELQTNTARQIISRAEQLQRATAVVPTAPGAQLGTAGGFDISQQRLRQFPSATDIKTFVRQALELMREEAKASVNLLRYVRELLGPVVSLGG